MGVYEVEIVGSYWSSKAIVDYSAQRYQESAGLMSNNVIVGFKKAIKGLVFPL